PFIHNINKEAIIKEFRDSHDGKVLYLSQNEYPVKKLENFFEGTNANGSIEHYENLPELRTLLRQFFTRYQEESIPNLVKLVHSINAKEIQDEKRKFTSLPIASRWIRKLMGKGWSISNYQKKI
ncbi:MAG: hypothetical protein ICV66_10275, partial [Chitinophagaceae bacterium]|nr:hypothetical protein [Chitinophagaceae bacterium]